jgi:hypothetical protein
MFLPLGNCRYWEAACQMFLVEGVGKLISSTHCKVGVANLCGCRNDSTSCRLWAAVRIQSAWRYRARKLRRLKAQAAAEASAHRQGVPRTPSQAVK